MNNKKYTIENVGTGTELAKGFTLKNTVSQLDLSQLEYVEELVKEKIANIRNQDKVKVYVFSSGVVNEGFFETKEGALQALKDYVNSKEFTVNDRVRVHSILQFKDEAQRLICGD